ncbi:hypothetical protein [Glycomyces terrestris]|uniref:Uncharacterized protein n=1 Tax=Glycomyces terrestris TaxID=2493553 RepID=A0A426V304_9ACTN|nr:hypothetical protein [Glycomyces terrestris]RRS01237.1 hypothetical protein EIW28_00165 [Glycomyces terrestris]
MSAIAIPLGLLLAVQGGGGLLNQLLSDSRSWFLLNYIDMPGWLRLTAHVLLLAAGLGLLVRSKGWRWLLDD